MKYWFTPEIFQQVALLLLSYRWRLLMWSLLAFLLFMILEMQIATSTPSPLVWLAIFILFAALQALVFASFIFFFQTLPSTKAEDTFWFKIYRTIEWCEAILFTILLPLPLLTFLYALLSVNGLK